MRLLAFLIALSASIGHSADPPPYCSKIIAPQHKDGLNCPFPPKRRNGKNCFAGTVIDLNRHARGYKDYILSAIRDAIKKTRIDGREGVDPTVLMSVLSKESWFNPMATNQWGDTGIAQFQLETAQATLEYMKTLGLEVPEKVNKEIPPGCTPNEYNVRLSSACFNGIRTNCEKAPYSSSLFCPSFALQLMAFHFLQIRERDVMIQFKKKAYNVSMLLAPEGDQESELRHLTSVYNRGFRIYNSAYYYFLNRSHWPRARHYGSVWAQNRGPYSRDKDPFEGGTLKDHHINRCYVWAITGICGGIKGSLVDSYTKLICPRTNAPQPVNKRLLASYRQGEMQGSLFALQEELFHKLGPWSEAEKANTLDLLLSIYEGDLSFQSMDLMSYLMNLSLRGFDVRSLESAVTTHAPKPDDKSLLSRLETLESTGLDFDEVRIIRAIAYRQSKLNPDEPNWLYVAGKAGHLHFLSGDSSLNKYLEECRAQSCSHVSDAKEMLRISQQIQQQRQLHRE